MHDMVDGRVFVFFVAPSSKVRWLVPKSSVSGAVERIGVHPLGELGVVRGGREWGIEVSM